jgi:hypothetical protein
MPDLKELYTSPDFASYQEAIADIAVDWLDSSLRSGIDGKVIKIGIDLINDVLSIPKNLGAPPEVQKRLDAAVKARLISIPAKLLRRELFDD